MFKASITFVLVLLLASIATTVAVPVAMSVLGSNVCIDYSLTRISLRPQSDSSMMLNRYERRDQLEKRWSFTWKKAAVGLAAAAGGLWLHKKYKERKAKTAVAATDKKAAAADNKAQGTPAPAPTGAAATPDAASASQATPPPSQAAPASQGSAPSQAPADSAAGSPPAYAGPTQ